MVHIKCNFTTFRTGVKKNPKTNPDKVRLSFSSSTYMGQSNSKTVKKKGRQKKRSSKKKQRNLITGNVPRHGTDDFFLPMPDAEEISNFFNDDNKNKSVHFIRSGVAVGKSTMIRYLLDTSNKFVLIDGKDGIGNWRKWLIQTYKEQSKSVSESASELNDALGWFETAHKVLVFDEAHRTFSQNDLVGTLYNNPKINILLFSASAEVNGDHNKIVETPKEITNIYLWRPKVSIDDNVISHLHDAGAYLDRDALLFILELCGEHFGITLHALTWVRTKQSQSNSVDIWDYSKTAKEVRKSIRLGWDEPNSLLSFVKISRAVRVNGGSEPTQDSFYPDVFAQVLFTGPCKIGKENMTAKKVLTVHGMIFPVRKTTQTTSLLRYHDKDAIFGVPHPLMCIFYQREFKRCNWKPFIKEEYKQPLNCTDLLARVIPHLSFLSVVSAPTTSYASAQTKDSTMSKQHNFPHEDQFQHAILKHLRKLGFETLMVMSNDEKIGRPDIVVPCGDKTFVVELLLATRTEEAHKEHILRFQTKSNYVEGTDKCIVTIGKDEKVVKERMGHLGKIKRKRINNSQLTEVEILGLVPTKAFCSYTLYKWASRSMEQFDFRVDGVSRSTCLLKYHAPISVVDVIPLIPREEHDRMVNKLKWQMQRLEIMIACLQRGDEQHRDTRSVVFCLHKGRLVLPCMTILLPLARTQLSLSYPSPHPNTATKT